MFDLLMYIRLVLTLTSLTYLLVILLYCVKAFKRPWAWILLSAYCLTQLATRAIIISIPSSTTKWVFESPWICFSYSIVELLLVFGLALFVYATRELFKIFFPEKTLWEQLYLMLER